MVKNSSFVSYPSQIPFDAVFGGIILYLIIQPDEGDSERGDVDADEELSESTCLNKDIQIFAVIVC